MLSPKYSQRRSFGTGAKAILIVLTWWTCRDWTRKSRDSCRSEKLNLCYCLSSFKRTLPILAILNSKSAQSPVNASAGQSKLTSRKSGSISFWSLSREGGKGMEVESIGRKYPKGQLLEVKKADRVHPPVTLLVYNLLQFINLQAVKAKKTLTNRTHLRLKSTRKKNTLIELYKCRLKYILPALNHQNKSSKIN